MANLNISLLFLFSISLNFHLSSTAMSSQSASIPLVSSFDSPAVHIVYTERPHNEEPEAYHIRTLVSVLGSEEAAREALVYSYKNAASGFSARLTPDQVTEITKQPGVLHVVQSGNNKLHSGGGGVARLH
ncbi:subtilisin-like protease SBT3.6 isoform X1 [Cucumis sativus]|uniref:Inhibitor I9 domain-containing protein n=2 Tax=Cucumis sativus TaxID=3659 RepID=A0A0A0K6B0_CUCSA|nr:subtilisin-like protease SBT3.6 isoform X1 [Cucumis sativus]